MKKIISFVLGLTMTMSLGTGSLSGCMVKERAFDNIIVVIGDGMGENHILNALTYFDLDIPVFMEDQVGWHGKAPNDELCEQALEELNKGGEA